MRRVPLMLTVALLTFLFLSVVQDQTIALQKHVILQLFSAGR